MLECRHRAVRTLNQRPAEHDHRQTEIVNVLSEQFQIFFPVAVAVLRIFPLARYGKLKAYPTKTMASWKHTPRSAIIAAHQPPISANPSFESYHAKQEYPASTMARTVRSGRSCGWLPDNPSLAGSNAFANGCSKIPLLLEHEHH